MGVTSLRQTPPGAQTGAHGVRCADCRQAMTCPESRQQTKLAASSATALAPGEPVYLLHRGPAGPLWVKTRVWTRSALSGAAPRGSTPRAGPRAAPEMLEAMTDGTGLVLHSSDECLTQLAHPCPLLPSLSSGPGPSPRPLLPLLTCQGLPTPGPGPDPGCRRVLWSQTLWVMLLVLALSSYR